MRRFVLISVLLLVFSGCSLKPQVMDGNGMIRDTEKTAELSFESFDGGGPDFDVVIDDESIVSYERSRVYSSPDHEAEDGAGYTVRYSFTGLKPGETDMTIMERSPIADNLDHLYKVCVNEDLHVEIVLQGTANIDEKDMTPNGFLTVRIADRCFSVDPAGNASAEAFIERLRSENIEVSMKDNAGSEKVGELPWDLPQNDEEITTEPGDLLLYQGNRISVCYDEAKLNITILGRLNADPEEITEIFGGKDEVTAAFFMEWTE